MSRKWSARVRVVVALATTGCAAGSAAPAPPGVVVGIAGFGAAGLGGAGQAATGFAGAPPGGVGFAATVEPFVTKACNCHQSNPLMAPFSMKVGEGYANLVNAPSQQLPSMMRVKASSMTESYLWYKINGTQAQVGGSGMIMPYTSPLNADEKAIFERWIAAGAPP